MGGLGSGRSASYTGKATTEDSLPLDIRRLQRAGVPAPGWVCTWQWTVNDRVRATIGIRAEAENIALSYNYTAHGQPAEAISQTVWVASSACALGGHRRWFACPACSRRVAVLYGAGRLFACRRCKGLAYASQGESGDDRAAWRAGRIRTRLGWLPGILNGNGTRPKGMHRSTDQRSHLRELVGKLKENDGFQQTCGVIRLMQMVVADLWKSGKADGKDLIHPYDIDLNIDEIASEVRTINPSLSEAIAHDIAHGGGAEVEQIDLANGNADASEAARLILVASLSTTPASSPVPTPARFEATALCYRFLAHDPADLTRISPVKEWTAKIRMKYQLHNRGDHFEVELRALPRVAGIAIRYTTDGSAPTHVGAASYDDTFRVPAGSRVVCAIAGASDVGLYSEVLRVPIPQPGGTGPKLDATKPARWTQRAKLDDAGAVWDFIQRLAEAATVVAFDLQLTAESIDGLQHVEYSGALDAGYTAASMKTAADKLQEIVGAGALRMTVGSLGFATGQALLDWLKATNQPFDAAKVQQQA